ncbi:hypothetical protein HHI36_018311, partial [Cryptolaemus montrouzieri]
MLKTPVAIVIYDPFMNIFQQKTLNEIIQSFEELSAIALALDHILQHHVNIIGDRTLVLSENQSILQSITEMKIDLSTTIIHRKLLWGLHNLKDLNIDVCFMWVKAHMGIPSNEKVDKAAKMASTLKVETSECAPSDIYLVFKRKLFNSG